MKVLRMFWLLPKKCHGIGGGGYLWVHGLIDYDGKASNILKKLQVKEIGCFWKLLIFSKFQNNLLF